MPIGIIGINHPTPQRAKGKILPFGPIGFLNSPYANGGGFNGNVPGFPAAAIGPGGVAASAFLLDSTAQSGPAQMDCIRTLQFCCTGFSLGAAADTLGSLYVYVVDSGQVIRYGFSNIGLPGAGQNLSGTISVIVPILSAGNTKIWFIKIANSLAGNLLGTSGTGNITGVAFDYEVHSQSYSDVNFGSAY